MPASVLLLTFQILTPHQFLLCFPLIPCFGPPTCCGGDAFCCVICVSACVFSPFVHLFPLHQLYCQRFCSTEFCSSFLIFMTVHHSGKWKLYLSLFTSKTQVCIARGDKNNVICLEIFSQPLLLTMNCPRIKSLRSFRVFKNQGILHWIIPAADTDSSCFIAKIVSADASKGQGYQ